MLHEFLSAHRSELIDRCRTKVAARPVPLSTAAAMTDGIPAFLDQLVKTLRVEQTADPMQSRRVSGASGGGHSATSEIGATAARHGRELLKQGFTVEQVVHDYGDVCQAVTDLAFELDAPIETDEFRTLNRCLDNAIADAVTEFNYHRDLMIADKQTDTLNVRLGFFAHELRNLINTVSIGFSIIKEGNVGASGATGTIVDRSLLGLRHLIDRTLAEVRMAAGLPVQHQLFSLSDFIAELTTSSSLEARVRGCTLTTSAVDRRLAVDADRDLLLSAAGNLLQNAFKFTQPGTEITLVAHAIADRIHIDVKDNCGGLPAGDAERMFRPFVQGGADKTGLGLGLSIARRSVEANGGTLRVRDVPGTGCVFTIDVPRRAVPELALSLVSA